MVVFTTIGRAVLCLAMAQFITEPSPEGLLIYPLAFGILVFQKTYSVARSALVPALVEDDDEFVRANSRLALDQPAREHRRRRAGLRAPGGVRRPLLPGAGDGDLRDRRRARGEDPAHPDRAERQGGGARAGGDPPAEHPPRRERDGDRPRRGRVHRVLLGLRVQGRQVRARSVRGLRTGSAASPGTSWRRTSASASRRRRSSPWRSSRPRRSCLLGALMGGTFGAALAGFGVAVGSAGGRLGFDSLLQRDGPDAVRGRAFARFETRFQVAWVVGALVGIIPVERAARPARARGRHALLRALVRRGAARDARCPAHDHPSPRVRSGLRPRQGRDPRAARSVPRRAAQGRDREAHGAAPRRPEPAGAPAARSAPARRRTRSTSPSSDPTEPFPGS